MCCIVLIAECARIASPSRPRSRQRWLQRPLLGRGGRFGNLRPARFARDERNHVDIHGASFPAMLHHPGLRARPGEAPLAPEHPAAAAALHPPPRRSGAAQPAAHAAPQRPWRQVRPREVPSQHAQSQQPGVEQKGPSAPALFACLQAERRVAAGAVSTVEGGSSNGTAAAAAGAVGVSAPPLPAHWEQQMKAAPLGKRRVLQRCVGRARCWGRAFLAARWGRAAGRRLSRPAALWRQGVSRRPADVLSAQAPRAQSGEASVALAGSTRRVADVLPVGTRCAVHSALQVLRAAGRDQRLGARAHAPDGRAAEGQDRCGAKTVC